MAQPVPKRDTDVMVIGAINPDKGADPLGRRFSAVDEPEFGLG